MIRIFLLVCLTIVLTAASCWAFFPSPSTVAAQVDERLSGIESLQLEISSQDSPQWTIRLWKHGSLWRQEWVHGKGSGAYVAAAGLGQGDRLLASYPHVDRFPQPILLLWYADPVADWWRRWSIHPEDMDYGFENTRPCIVLGGLSGSAQSWIDNELHVPVKLTTRQGVQCIWGAYHRIGNQLLPHAVEIVPPGGDGAHFRLRWRGVNVDLPGKLFDQQDFLRRYPSTSGKTPDLPPGLADMWRLLPSARAAQY